MTLPALSRAASHKAGTLAGVALLVGVSCWLGTVASQEEGRIAAIWIANGFLVGILLGVDRVRWRSLLLAGYAGNVASNLVAGDAPAFAVVIAGFNSLEIYLAAALTARHGARVDLTSGAGLRAFLLWAVVVAPLVSGVGGAGSLAVFQGGDFVEAFSVWVAADALGIGIVTPLTLAVAQHGATLRGQRLRQWAVSTSMLALVTALVFLHEFPGLFLVLPVLVYVVFRHDYLGAAAGVGVIAVISVGLTLRGHGPLNAIDGMSIAQRVLLLQVFIAVCSAMALGTAMVLERRRRAEQGFAQSQRDLLAITNNLPALVAHIDAQERYRFINAQVKRVFGTDPESVIGQTMQVVRGEETYRYIAPYVARVLSGQPVTFEGVTEAQGQRYHYQSNYVPEIGDHGEVVGFYAVTFDITERKETELRLATSEKWLRAITDNIPAIVAYIDRDQRFRFANAHLGAAFDVEPGSLIGRRVSEVLGDTTYTLLAGPIVAALRGQRQRVEQVVRRTGREIHYLIDLVPDRDAQGVVNGTFGTVIDITARKTAELRQAASEARLRTITNGLPGLIAYIDRSARLRFCNATFELWFGVRPEDMIGHSLDDALGPRLLRRQEDAVRAALGGERVEVEFDVEYQGQRRNLQATYLPHRDPEGRILGVYTLASDITPLKRVELQLTKLARYDNLTGLPNRAEFQSRLSSTLARPRHGDEDVALMFLDVDHFKSINDRYGHPAGDEVLQEVAIRLQGCVRPQDTVARLAGDEFVVILDGVRGVNEAEFVAREMLSAIARPIVHHQHELRIGMSIGIALHVDPSCTVSELLAQADRALYVAKAVGRNTSRVFDGDAMRSTDDGAG